MDKKIQILVGSDENCLVGLVVTLASIINSCDKTRQLVFNIMDLGFHEETKEKMFVFFNRFPQVEIIFIHCDVSIYEKNGARSFEGMNFATYARLQAADMLNCDKCIYIDSDILVTKDVSELWDMNIDNYAMAAVLNSSKMGIVGCDKLSYECPFEHEEDISNFGYFNAGFLVCNLKKWREISLFEKSIDLIKKYKKQISSHDQTILNFLLRGQILALPNEWNYIPWWTRDMKELSNLHFTSKFKPWSLRLYLPEEKMWYALYNAKVKPFWDLIEEYKTRKPRDFFIILKQWLLPGFIPEVYCFLRRVFRNDSLQKRQNDIIQFRAMRRKLFSRQNDVLSKRIINDYCSQF
jgi:lipopolysaccharide biosynthesis glycosyltransferase